MQQNESTTVFPKYENVVSFLMTVVLQGRPGEKGERGLTVSKETGTNDGVIYTKRESLIFSMFVFRTQREEVVRIIREICGKFDILLCFSSVHVKLIIFAWFLFGC